jgi:hypothetical protein
MSYNAGVQRPIPFRSSVMDQKPANQVGNNNEPPRKMTPEEIEQYDDMIWAATDPDVQMKYPDEFVAAYRRQIIAHGDDEQKVLEEAAQITGLPKHRIAVTTVLGPSLLFGPR